MAPVFCQTDGQNLAFVFVTCGVFAFSREQRKILLSHLVASADDNVSVPFDTASDHTHTMPGPRRWNPAGHDYRFCRIAGFFFSQRPLCPGHTIFFIIRQLPQNGALPNLYHGRPRRITFIPRASESLWYFVARFTGPVWIDEIIGVRLSSRNHGAAMTTSAALGTSAKIDT